MNHKEVEQLKEDLKLVTKTAQVLATKLEKITNSVTLLLDSLEGKPTPQEVIEKAPSAPPAPKPSPAATRPPTSPSPSLTTSTEKVRFEGSSDSKAGRLLDSFQSQVQNMTKGKEISAALSRLRDQVMQSPDIGFHPAFHEMGRYANQLKNINEITAVEKEQLFEKIYDWKTRLTS